jgi:hypothetical protein
MQFAAERTLANGPAQQRQQGKLARRVISEQLRPVDTDA